MNVLFICSLNKIRSLTAQHIFENTAGLTVQSAGTQQNARRIISHSLLEWADIIFVMEREHEEKIYQKFPKTAQHKRVVCLNIENGYEYMDPDLVEILKREVSIYLTESSEK